MKKILIFLMLLLIPFIGYAEDRYEQYKSYTSDYSVMDQIIGKKDEYIYTLSYNKINKIDEELNIVDSKTIDGYAYYNIKKAIMVDNTIIAIILSNNKIIMYKTNTDFTTEESVEVLSDVYSIVSTAYMNNKIYMKYTKRNESYQTTEYWTCFDINGNVLYNEVFPKRNSESVGTIFSHNNQLYMYSYVGDILLLFKVNTENNSLERELLRMVYDYALNDLDSSNNKIIAIKTDRNTYATSIVELDNDLNIIKERGINPEDYGNCNRLGFNANDYEYFLITACTQQYYQNGEGYSGYGNPKLNVYDHDGNYSYSIDYEEERANRIGNIITYADNQTVYVFGNYGKDMYGTSSGSFYVSYKIARPEKNEYVVKTKVSSGKGSITTNKNKGEEGEVIEYIITPDEGYKVKNIKVYTDDGDFIEFHDNRFTIPNNNVTIEVEFSKKIIDTEILSNPSTKRYFLYIFTYILLVGFLILEITKKYKKEN